MVYLYLNLSQLSVFSCQLISGVDLLYHFHSACGKFHPTFHASGQSSDPKAQGGDRNLPKAKNYSKINFFVMVLPWFFNRTK
jgi:hypothetical protein